MHTLAGAATYIGRWTGRGRLTMSITYNILYSTWDRVNIKLLPTRPLNLLSEKEKKRKKRGKKNKKKKTYQKRKENTMRSKIEKKREEREKKKEEMKQNRSNSDNRFRGRDSDS